MTKIPRDGGFFVREKPHQRPEHIYYAPSANEFEMVLSESKNFNYQVETYETLIDCFGEKEEIPEDLLDALAKYNGKVVWYGWGSVSYIQDPNSFTREDAMLECISNDLSRCEIYI